MQACSGGVCVEYGLVRCVMCADVWYVVCDVSYVVFVVWYVQ